MRRVPLVLLLLLLLSIGPAAAGPGDAFTLGDEVTKIDDTGKLTRIVGDAEHPTTMALDADGDLWVSSIGGKLTGYKAKRRTVQLPNKDPNSRYAVAITAAKGGGVWALGRERL